MREDSSCDPLYRDGGGGVPKLDSGGGGGPNWESGGGDPRLDSGWEKPNWDNGGGDPNWDGGCGDPNCDGGCGSFPNEFGDWGELEGMCELSAEPAADAKLPCFIPIIC